MLATVVDSYRRADNPKQLIKAVSDVLAEVPSTGIDTEGENMFELISPLTDEVVLSLISEITKVPGNQPIGTQLVTPAQATEMSAPTLTVNTGTSQPSSNQKSNIGFLIIIIGLLVITWLIFKKIKPMIRPSIK